MIRYRLIALLAALILGMNAAPSAIAQNAAIAGVVRAQVSGEPVPFALVRLVRADSSALPSDNSPQGITNADGRYRLSDVAPGRYRVQLRRIGFRPVLSDAVQVAAGETVQLDLRATSLPIALPPVTATSELCVPAKNINKYPQLQALWQQARDGASVRTELMARFRYHLSTHEEAVARKPDGTPTGAVDQSYVSDPKWAARTAANRRSQRLSRGYYGQTEKNGDVSFYAADELDILHEDFLKAHCLVPTAQRGDGEIGLRFHPLRARRNFLDIGGTVWLDSATFLARRIELEYVDADDARGTVRIDFSDIPVAGGPLRMPVGGAIDLRSSRKDPARRVESKLTMTYWGFEEVPPR